MIQHRPDSLSRVALWILLVTVVWACSKPASDQPPPSIQLADPPKPGAGKTADAPQKMEFRGPGTLVPKTVEGWAISSAPRYFGPANLFDLINGGAEIYVEYGLKEMVTVDYRDKSTAGVTITLEVYDQGTPLGAFGRVARFLAGRLDPSDAGKGLSPELAERGIFGSGDLIFWKGQYLVHLTLLDESPTATPESINAAGQRLLPKFAAAVSAKIKENPSLPSELASFPPEGRLARSGAWLKSKLAGLDELGAGFTVRYKEGDTHWTMCVTDQFKTPEAAKTNLGQATAAWQKKNEQTKRLTIAQAGNRLVCLAQNAAPYLADKKRDELLKSLGESLSKK